MEQEHDGRKGAHQSWHGELLPNADDHGPDERARWLQLAVLTAALGGWIVAEGEPGIPATSWVQTRSRPNDLAS